MTKSKANLTTKRKDAGRKTKSITRRKKIKTAAELSKDCAKALQLLVRLKAGTVVITYTDGTKETMSRNTFNQIIKG